MCKKNYYFAPTVDLIFFETNDITNVSQNTGDDLKLIPQEEGIGSNEFTY